jgi:ribose transport system permease protein
LANRASSQSADPPAYSAMRVEGPARRFNVLIERLPDYSTALVVILLLILFGLTSQYFLRPDNLLNIVKQMSIVGVLAIGTTMVILIGGIDLSVGSVALISGGTTAVLMANNPPMPAVPAILIGLLVGGTVGLVNGFLIEIGQISPVIVTLGTWIGIRGLGQIVINNTWVAVTDPLFDGIAIGKVGFLPMMATIMLALYLVAAIVLQQTRFGRYVYAIGGNPVAARLSALPVIRTRILVYVISGVLAGVGGMLIAAYVGQIGPSDGAGLEFEAIAAVVLGGTRLGGGSGRVEKTLLGTAILTMVLNYLTLAHVPGIWQQTVTGVLVLLAVLLDRVLRRARAA